jgi:hypothetical protein
MATTHGLLHWDKQSFIQWKIVDVPTSFIWIIIFFNGSVEYGDGGIFKLLWQTQNLHQSCDHNKTTFARNQKYERGWWLEVKIHILWKLMNRCT